MLGSTALALGEPSHIWDHSWHTQVFSPTSLGTSAGLHHHFQVQMNLRPDIINSLQPSSVQAQSRLGGRGAEPQQPCKAPLVSCFCFFMDISPCHSGLQLTRNFQGCSINSSRMFSHSTVAGAGAPQQGHSRKCGGDSTAQLGCEHQHSMAGPSPGWWHKSCQEQIPRTCHKAEGCRVLTEPNCLL